MVLLALTFGMMLAAAEEAWMVDDRQWAAGFAVLAGCDAVMYFWATHHWVKYLYG